MTTLSENSRHSGPAVQNKPRLIFWELTKGCNLRCIHCRASATELSSPDDLSTSAAKSIIDQIAEVSSPILVLSGGEPLFRKDIFELARYGTDKGLRVALATNGTLVTKEVAQKIFDSGVKRVAISLDGTDAATHDKFRSIPGAFDAALAGFRNLKALGMSVQINTTVARHNAHQLPQMLELAKSIGADALHTFLLVPVGCGVDIAAEQMVPPEEYERMLNWFYDESLKGGIELKATCAPHYFRVVRQRRAAGAPFRDSRCPGRAESSSTGVGLTQQGSDRHRSHRYDDARINRHRTSPSWSREGRWTRSWTSSWSPRNPPVRHECHDQRLPGRNCRLFHLESRRGLSLWILTRTRRRSEETALRRYLGELRCIQPTARREQPEREVRLLRVSQCLHGLPRPRLCRHWELSR
jgi:MoaA/NifB/PqqE/SkfB family radical SAM enzyme